MNTINWNDEEIKCKILKVINETAGWNSIENPPILQTVYEYDNDILVSKTNYRIGVDELNNQLKQISEQNDCSLTIDQENNVLTAVRRHKGLPKIFIVKYYINPSLETT